MYLCERSRRHLATIDALGECHALAFQDVFFSLGYGWKSLPGTAMKICISSRPTPLIS